MDRIILLGIEIFHGKIALGFFLFLLLFFFFSGSVGFWTFLKAFQRHMSKAVLHWSSPVSSGGKRTAKAI